MAQDDLERILRVKVRSIDFDSQVVGHAGFQAAFQEFINTGVTSIIIEGDVHGPFVAPKETEEFLVYEKQHRDAVIAPTRARMQSFRAAIPELADRFKTAHPKTIEMVLGKWADLLEESTHAKET